MRGTDRSPEIAGSGFSFEVAGRDNSGSTWDGASSAGVSGHPQGSPQAPDLDRYLRASDVIDSASTGSTSPPVPGVAPASGLDSAGPPGTTGKSGEHPNPDLLRDYRCRPGVYDELMATGVSPLPHWEYVLQGLQGLSAREIVDRDRETRRLLRENGVTYNVHGDPGGASRPWGLDSIPALYTSSEWTELETGLAQRAELLSELLRDFYGERKSLRRGLVPPELVYAHRGYLRPCVGLYGGTVPPLHLYAADIVRGRNGSPLVLADRTQAPSGAGYALENRMVIQRVFPSLYRDANVHRLAMFFRTLRTALSDLGGGLDDNPRVVLMTAGAGAETFFEQSYLANSLGYSLAQGHDLTVREGKVWLKTLDDGLKRVHVIWRRVDDAFCDPLELRRDSLLGTPGLLEAVREGQVVVSNPLGSGLAENTGLLAYLPKLCRELLGQDLTIPSAPTWWCGDPVGRSHVLSRLDQMVIKGIQRQPGLPVYGGDLSESQLDELRRRIQRSPHDFVGQDIVAASTAPCLSGTNLVPRTMVLRSYLVAKNDSFVTMPGGLTRAATSATELFVTNQRGGTSKDTWVIASEREPQVTLLPPVQPSVPVALSRAGGEVPSSVADHLYWLGRYAERVEFSVRVLRETYTRLQERSVDRKLLARILPVVTHVTGTLPGFLDDTLGEARREAPEEELYAILSDQARSGSIAGNVQRFLWNAVQIRDRFSEDGWLIMQGLKDEIPGEQTILHPAPLGVTQVLERLLVMLGAFTGLCVESMSRGQGFHFIELGRRVERGQGVISLLRAALLWTGEYDPQLLPFLLAVNDNRTTYSRRYRLDAQLGPVLDLFVQDLTNPRSIAFQLDSLRRLCEALPAPSMGTTGQMLDIVEATAAGLVSFDADALCEFAVDPTVKEILVDQLARFAKGFGDVSSATSKLYFEQTDLPQQMVAIGPD